MKSLKTAVLAVSLILATATHADDFNDAVFFLRISEIHDAGSVIVIFHNFN